MKIANWGNYPQINAQVRSFTSEHELKKLLEKYKEVIPRGLGRCYGDSALNDTIISTRRFNRIKSFNENTGIISCESGVSLSEILDIFVPRGWFLPTTPGTKFVTVGGAVASDVHGKNHHVAGSFSRHLDTIDVMLSDGNVISCSRNGNDSLFRSTCGGMGLTGVILNAAFTLKSVETAFIKSETVKARDLDEIMDLFEGSSSWTYSVAWMDCLSSGKDLGRSLLIRGEHAKTDDLVNTEYYRKPLVKPGKLNFNVPFNMPGFLLNRYFIQLFNKLYYSIAPDRPKGLIVDYDSFFYPLDRIKNWNRIYGNRGFTQYQFVLPLKHSREGIKKILGLISRRGAGPFLAVLKLFGKQEGLLSFPMEGYSLSLDFPVSTKYFSLLDELDEIVLEFGGRLYLTKDARMNEQTFKKGYENAGAFIECKNQFDEAGKFQSLQSKRLGV